MRDERLWAPGAQLVNRSVALQKGEHLLVSSPARKTRWLWRLSAAPTRRALSPPGHPEPRAEKGKCCSFTTRRRRGWTTAWERPAGGDGRLHQRGDHRQSHGEGEVPREKLALTHVSWAIRSNRRRREGRVRWCVTLTPRPFTPFLRACPSAGLRTTISTCAAWTTRAWAGDGPPPGADGTHGTGPHPSRGHRPLLSIRGVLQGVAPRRAQTMPDGESNTAPVRDSTTAPSPLTCPPPFRACASRGCASGLKTAGWRGGVPAVLEALNRILIPIRARALSANSPLA
jgi:hypothetical protein